MSASKSLLKVMTTPCKLASALDWRRISGSTLLSLDIHADRIGIARCSHPNSATIKSSTQQQQQDSVTCHRFESLPLDRKTKTLSEDAKKTLAEIVKENNVCGFVVSWPLQQDTGRMGASCGRTLYTLEQLMKDGNNSIFSSNRPLCLWDSKHVQPTKTDCFGRSVEFARTPADNKTLHLASQEQYHQDEDIAASQVWEDFCKQYWPEDVAEQTPENVAASKASRPTLVGGRKSTSSYTTSGSWQSASSRRTALVAA